MKYQEYTNTEILDKVNEILRTDEYKSFSLAYVLKVKDECQNCYAVAMDGDRIIGFNPFESEINDLPEWDFNVDTELFEELEWNREIIYMSMECHYGVWNEVSNYYIEDIEHKEGMQKYIDFCLRNGITQELLEERFDSEIMNIMKYDNTYIGCNNGIMEMSMERFKTENEIHYISFVLGYDLLNEMLSENKLECDISYDFCDYLARKFIKTENYKNERESTYEILEKWVKDNKDVIKSEQLVHSKIDDKLILETGERRGTPVALVKRENEKVKEYIIAFDYEVSDNKVQWGYGYYYDKNIEKAKEDFEKVKAGGNLSDTFNNDKTLDTEKLQEKKIKNKNRDAR